MANSSHRECLIYDPQAQPWDSTIKLWGTRGSVPVSGSAYTSFGGNTSCLEIRRHHHTILIDAGTGIRGAGDDLIRSEIRQVHLIFGHTHWDHLIGFPFFMPLYNPEFTIHVYAVESPGKKIKDALHQILWPDYFPVQLEEMKAELRFHSLKVEEAIQVDDVSLSCILCDHPGGALGFKIEIPGRMIGYATDHEFLKGYRGLPDLIDPNHPLLEPYQNTIEFFRGCRPLIHEAQYAPREYAGKIGWGHSSMANAAVLAKLCGIREWVITHHDPAATDEKLRFYRQVYRTIVNDLSFDCSIELAFDGMILPL